jgi:tRNA-2-methylthio-N6-dimethylallyladenosine synthase
VEKARFALAYTFQYSMRPGTPAADMPDQVPKEVVQERYERLKVVQDRIAWEENTALVGSVAQVLVATNEGKKDSKNHRLSGRAEDSRLVHFTVPEGSEVPRPGDVVSVVITEAKPFFLLADSPHSGGYELRRTRAGDAYDRWQAESCGAPIPGASPSPRGVSLGLPSFGPTRSS